MSNFEFSKYCTPAQLYLVLGVIGLISGFFKNYGIETLLTKALFLVIWAWVLNWLCSKGFKAVSWILVLLPFILVLFMFFFIKDVMVKEGMDSGRKGRCMQRMCNGKTDTDLQNCRNHCAMYG